MKLLAILPSKARGGAEEYALTIATAAAKNGWDVHAAFPQAESTASLIQDFQSQGVTYHRLEIDSPSFQKFRLITEYLPQFIRTLFLLVRVKPAIVITTLPWPDRCFGSLIACGLLKIPTTVVFQLVADRFPFSSHKLRAYHWMKRRNQQWIAVSKDNQKIISDSFQIPFHEILCIYNGSKIVSASIHHELEETETVRHQIRRELKLPINGRIALTIGRLIPQKGYSDLIPAIKCVTDEFPEVRFVWVGEGEQREDLTNKVREYGVEDKVLFLGYRSDIPKLLQASDLFVFPTRHEGLPFALLEAMAYGLPIVASNASSIPEIIQDKVQGLLFQAGNGDDLLKTLRWALSHPEQMQPLAQSAKQRAQDFSEDRMTQETLGLLQRLSPVPPKAN